MASAAAATTATASQASADGQVGTCDLQPYRPVSKTTEWIGVHALPPQSILDECVKLYETRNKEKPHRIVTVPGTTSGRESYHIFLLGGIPNSADWDKAAKLVQDAHLTMNDLEFGKCEDWQTPFLLKTGTRVLVSHVHSDKLVLLHEQLAKAIPHQQTRQYEFKPHVSCLWIQEESFIQSSAKLVDS